MYKSFYPLTIFALFLNPFFLISQEAADEEFYILPDFVVTDDDDKGYYSANTLAGTRTNELTKNIPMTISTVNAEMIEDFKMKTLEDLGNFVPSIEAEGNVYNNNEIRFRGLLTRSQLYEFMPRYSPLDWYNVGRSDIIRGANSLIYGQADPGGKVNVISKTAMLTKSKGNSVVEIGDNSWHKFSYDWNQVLGDNTAARIMLIDKHREFDANYKYQSFNGATLEFLHNLSPSTRLRLHLETGKAERSLIGGTFKVGTTPTGLPNGIVADPKLADLISDELLEEIAGYSDVNEFDQNDYNSIYPLVNDGQARLYGFIDRDADGVLEKNFDDPNGNESRDTASRVIAFTDYNNDGELSYNGTITSNGIVWNPINDRAVSHLIWDQSTGSIITNPTAVGLEGTDSSLWRSVIKTDANGDIEYFPIDTNGDGIIGLDPVTGLEDTRDIVYTWEDANENGILDAAYNEETGEYILEEAVSFIDNDGNGTFDVSNDIIDPQVGGDNSVQFTDEAYWINSATANRTRNFVLLDETFTDFNNNGVYDDSDYASGGLQVRANSPNIWGFSPNGGGLVPDFIDDRDDIRQIFNGIDYSNSGTGFGPDAYSKKSFDYVLADIEHSFSDNFSMKASFAFEDLVDDQLSSGWSANQINFSSGYGITVRYPTLRSINNYNNDSNNNGITTPFEAVLVDLTNSNYAHLVLDNITNTGIENIRSNLQSAFTTWTGNLNQLAPHNDENGIPVFSDIDGNGLEDDMIDYFVDEFLDLSEANNTLEQYYELSKFGGRVKNFLRRSHATYGSDYDYAWGNTPSGGGRSLGDILYDVLTGSTTELGAPRNTAALQIYNLDRYIDVPTYRTELQNFSNSNLLDDNNYLDLTSYTWQNPASYAYANPALANTIQNLLNQGISNPLTDMAPYLIPADEFTLDETGERLIYDSISNWLIEGINGVDREMLALPFVEIANSNEDNNGIDGFIDVNDEDEVELQKRALAKRVYDVLVENANDINSDNEFWDGTKEVYDIFKYELHPTNDYSWMWESYIQPSLLTTLDAIVEDTDYLSDDSLFIDINGDGIRDVLPSMVKSNVEILQPFIKRQWKKSSNKDNNRSARITYNYNEQNNFIPGKQQFLFGIDLDNRKASRSEEQLVSLNARTWGDALNLYLRNEILSDFVVLDDIIYDNEGDYANFDFNISGHQYDGAPNWITNTHIPLDENNVANWAKTYEADATVESNALWFAASGSYLNGKLRTLIGIRRDDIKTESEYSRFTLRAVRNDQENLGANLEVKSQVYDETIYSPSIGGLYWFNKNIALFGNYSESVISPNGFQFDVFGDITPPETGKGKEIGFKLSTQDNVLNGQLTVFSIDKKNEQRQNVSWPMLTSIYPWKNPDGSVKETPYDNGHFPSEIYDFYPYETRDGEPLRDDSTGAALVRGEFNPKGYRVADEAVRSEGLELDLYYNPTNNISLFLGYAYLETLILESALDVLEGLPTAGTSDHNVNFTFKYSFKQGKYKGLQIGMNQKYRSAALLSHYFVDLDGDNQADYIAREVEDPRSGEITTLQPRYNTLWLEDQHRTDFFIKWSGKIKKSHPWTVLQINVNNVFDNKNLISTGLNNARYTDGRNVVLSAGIYF